MGDSKLGTDEADWYVMNFPGGMQWDFKDGKSYVNIRYGDVIGAQFYRGNEGYGPFTRFDTVREAKEWIVAQWITRQTMRRLTE
jgi:hypothetical protein